MTLPRCDSVILAWLREYTPGIVGVRELARAAGVSPIAAEMSLMALSDAGIICMCDVPCELGPKYYEIVHLHPEE